MDLLLVEILGNTLQSWLIALAIAATVMVVAGVVRFLLVKQLNRMAVHTGLPFWQLAAAVVKRTRWLFILILALLIGAIVLSIPDKTRSILNAGFIVVLIIQAGLWASAAMRVSVEEYRKHQLDKDPASVTTLNVINFICKILIWTIVLLLVLDNLGVNITALVAGLGVGGIAVALALQTILSDLFASLSIVLDKPFVVGDFLIVGDLLGSVEYVGLKTTRLRSLSGEQLVFANADLLNSRIRNFGRMYERRVVFNIGVTYQTPRAKLVKIPQIIREAIEGQQGTRFDRSHFKEYGDFSLVFETVYYVNGPDYNKYMDIHQAINLFIHEQFEKEDIVFAYPTQTVFVEKS